METKFILATVLIVSVVAAVFAVEFASPTAPNTPGQIKRFASYEELKAYIQNRASDQYTGYVEKMSTGQMVTTSTGQMTTQIPKTMNAGAGSDYSTTNIQVAGVDEADTIKNDGNYIYITTSNGVSIINAYPAENATILSNINLSSQPRALFVNGNKLVVFLEDYNYYESPIVGIGTSIKGAIVGKPVSYGGSQTRILTYDITDRKSPIQISNTTIDGSYFESRMIGNNVYAVINQLEYGDPVLPVIYYDGEAHPLKASDVYYFDDAPISSGFTMTTVMSIDLEGSKTRSETFLLGPAIQMYVSKDNIYITYTQWNDIYSMKNMIEKVFVLELPKDIAQKISSSNDSYKVIQDYYNSLSESEKQSLQSRVAKRMIDYQQEIAKQVEKTIIHRIGIKDGNILYGSRGEVPGTVLNQFSMDENNGYFRIATTTGHVAREGATSRNNLYVLDGSLKLTGKIEDLAPGERIYSARFMGNKAYLVTFRKVDPLFVIDLSDPANPKVLGKLKIPGYSDYLHPYDETYLIGIGKDTVPAEEGDFSWYQGVKISIFDVSDLEHPKEVANYKIGDRGTDSPVLQDHKAFLFNKEKGLMVIPILLAEVSGEKKSPTDYGEFTYQGAYVFNITADSITLRGRITHSTDEDAKKSGFYYGGATVTRSLYIGNVLYTISNKMIKMNALDTLQEINKVDLPYAEYRYITY